MYDPDLDYDDCELCFPGDGEAPYPYARYCGCQANGGPGAEECRCCTDC